ncbi:MAG: hypothetical protein J5833_06765 [Victivallales bacterium]|nr:hypothetical protein [Victivallales bacterium]
MDTLRSRTWLWCHNRGVYNNIEALHAQSDYTPVEALEYMGIRNALMVVYGGKPEPPFEAIQEKYSRLDKVVWSIIGDSSSKRNQGQTDIEEVIALSRKYPNVKGGIMDDFFQVGPNLSNIGKISARMHEANLPLWVVLYAHQLDEAEKFDMTNVLPLCDVITFWNWWAKDLKTLKPSMERLKKLAPGIRVVQGCYLWDFGKGGEISPEYMSLQLEQAREWLADGTIHDVILLGSPLFGMNLQTIEQARSWLDKYGDMPCHN